MHKSRYSAHCCVIISSFCMLSVWSNNRRGKCEAIFSLSETPHSARSLSRQRGRAETNHTQKEANIKTHSQESKPMYIIAQVADCSHSLAALVNVNHYCYCHQNLKKKKSSKKVAEGQEITVLVLHCQTISTASGYTTDTLWDRRKNKCSGLLAFLLTNHNRLGH